MRIFVAYGYRDRDQWVKDLVFPIVEAFGDTVVTGEELAGEVITDAVRRKIQSADALIAMATRREEAGAGRWSTHRWVLDELSYALANRKKVVEVRETGVDEQGGIAGDRQRIMYDEAARDRCLVSIVKTLGNWHRENLVQVRLGPEKECETFAQRYKSNLFKCTYRLLVNNQEGEEQPAQITPRQGALYVLLPNVPVQADIQIQIVDGETVWRSDYEPADVVKVDVKRRNV
jgi:hypothetical protein